MGPEDRGSRDVGSEGRKSSAEEVAEATPGRGQGGHRRFLDASEDDTGQVVWAQRCQSPLNSEPARTCFTQKLWLPHQL